MTFYRRQCVFWGTRRGSLHQRTNGKRSFSATSRIGLRVMNRRALTGYYEGTSNLFEVEHIQAWLTPVLAWACVLLCPGVLYDDAQCHPP